MAPRTRYSRSDVIEATLRVIREEGLDAVTARSVARSLNSSIGPLFTSFASLDELRDAALNALVEHFRRHLHDERSLDPLIAAGADMVVYAVAEPCYFSALFMTFGTQRLEWLSVKRDIEDRMAEFPRYAMLDAEQLDAVMMRFGMVAQGVALEAWSGRLGRPRREAVVRLLEDIGDPVIDASILNGRRSFVVGR